MNNPTTAIAEGFALRRPRVALASGLAEAWRFGLRHWGLFAALAVTFAVHAPTLRYYFDGDDFVVLGSIEHLGARQYITDTVLMRDIVPNWRPLTGAIYAVEWNLFGLNPAAWRTVNLAVHLASLGILYALVTRVTKRPAIGAMSALVFGISGAHFDTVTYVTALPHVLGTCLTLASLLAIVTYTLDGERNPAAYWLSFALFVAAFLANEGSFVYAPVLVAAYALFSKRWRHEPLQLVLHAAPFVLLSAGWLAYYQAFPNPQIKFDGYGWGGGHVFTNYGVYLSFIAFPAHHVPLTPDTTRWVLASIVAAMAIFFAVRGPNIARVCALGVFLALLPFAPVSIWTAPRYMYGAVAFFAPAAAISAYWLFDRVRSTSDVVRAPATAAALVLVAAVAMLYGWQTQAQESRYGERIDRWELLANELQRNYEDVPDGTTIWIVDGPWTNPMEQYTWVPGVARALYGDAAAFNLPRQSYVDDPPSLERAVFLEWKDGEGLRPIAPEQVLAAR